MYGQLIQEINLLSVLSEKNRLVDLLPINVLERHKISWEKNTGAAFSGLYAPDYDLEFISRDA